MVDTSCFCQAPASSLYFLAAWPLTSPQRGERDFILSLGNSNSNVAQEPSGEDPLVIALARKAEAEKQRQEGPDALHARY